MQGVACYHLDSNFLEAVRLDSTKEIFLEHPQLAAMIDRLTYMGAAELFLDGETSLLHSLRSQPRTIPTLAIGAIIEHQKRSLEESKWKPKVQRVIACLLEDLLSLYDEEYPLRRARCLIWKIEAAYFSDEQEMNVDVIAQDALEALADDVSEIGNDSMAQGLNVCLRTVEATLAYRTLVCITAQPCIYGKHFMHTVRRLLTVPHLYIVLPRMR